MNRISILSGVALASIAVACSTSSYAQSINDGTSVPPGAEDSLGEIIVTARKKSEISRDVPVSVNVVSSEQLVASNVSQLVDLPRLSPSVQATFGAVSPIFYIRGFGSGASVSFDQAVGKFVNNVSYGRDQDARIPLFDVERVEVLKGPQVLSFGEASTAGALNIATKRPGSQFSLNGTVGYEVRNQQLNSQFGMTLPISDIVSLRIAGLYDDLSKGWTSNRTTKETEPTQRSSGARATLGIEPAAGTKMYFMADLSRAEDRGHLFQAFSILSPGSAPLFADARLDKYTESSNLNAPFNSTDFSRIDAGHYQFDLEQDVLGGTLNLTTAYRATRFRLNRDTDASALSVFNGVGGQTYKQFSQEIRFNKTIGNLDLTLDGYYQSGQVRSWISQQFNLAALGSSAPPFARLVEFYQDTKTYSGFIDGSYHITPQLILGAGVRFSRTDKTADQSLIVTNVLPNSVWASDVQEQRAAVNTALNAAAAATGATPHNFVGMKVRNNLWQPQIVLTYKPIERLTLYGKFVSGAKPSGFDYLYVGSDPSQMLFNKETARSYELGVKGSLASGKVDFSLVAFNMIYKDLQNSVFQPLTSTFLVKNVGKARSRGIEFDLYARPVQGLRIAASAAYTDAKYLDYQQAGCSLPQNLVTPPPCTQDLSGTPTPYNSKWSGNLDMSYRAGILNDSYMLEFGTVLTAKSKYNAGSFNDALQVQPGYAQIDARLKTGPQDGPWSLTFFVNNLTDKRLLTFATQATAIRGVEAGTISRGRQFGLRLEFGM